MKRLTAVLFCVCLLFPGLAISQTLPHTFGGMTGAIPLQYLDDNFTYINNHVYTVTTQNIVTAINVKVYGATGNGITDDTVAIQAASTAAAAAGGGIIFVPAGTYKMNAAQVTLGSNTTLDCGALGAVTFVRSVGANSTTAIFGNSDQVGGNSNITIRNCAFSQTVETGAASFEPHVRLYKVTGSLVEHNSFTGVITQVSHVGKALMFWGQYNISRGNIFTNIPDNPLGFHGDTTCDGTGNRSENDTIVRTTISAGNSAIIVTQSNVAIQNPTVIGAGGGTGTSDGDPGVWLETGACLTNNIKNVTVINPRVSEHNTTGGPHDVTGLSIIGGEFRNDTFYAGFVGVNDNADWVIDGTVFLNAGIRLRNIDGVSISNVRIVGNTGHGGGITNETSNGITAVSSVKHLSLLHNSIHSVDGTGVFLNGPTKSLLVKGNLSYNNGQSPVGGSAAGNRGFTFYSLPSGALIDGNVSFDDQVMRTQGNDIQWGTSDAGIIFTNNVVGFLDVLSTTFQRRAGNMVAGVLETYPITIPTPLVALGGGAAPTLGTIGGAGPASAAQNTWIKLFDSGGNAVWVPAWK